MVDYPTNAVQIVSFVAEHFKELASSPILSSHFHVILHVGLCPGIAESICFKAVLTLLPQGEGARQGG